MSKEWAIVVNNIIGNVILADEDFIESHPDFSSLERFEITDYDPKPGIMWKLENGKFIAPDHVKPLADHVLEDGLHEIEVR